MSHRFYFNNINVPCVIVFDCRTCYGDIHLGRIANVDNLALRRETAVSRLYGDDNLRSIKCFLQTTVAVALPSESGVTVT